jgi:hypothetical protein
MLTGWKVEELEQLLRKFGMHKYSCSTRSDEHTLLLHRKCDCGWDGVLQRIEDQTYNERAAELKQDPVHGPKIEAEKERIRQQLSPEEEK